jgi:hypothetical protein
LGKDSCVEIHKVGKGEDPRRNTGVFYLQEVLVRIPSRMLFGSSYYTYLIPTAHALKLVWHLPINITTGPELDSNWFKVANQH